MHTSKIGKPFILTILGISFIVLTHFPSSAQSFTWAKKFINNIVNDTTSAEKPKFIAYPTLAYTPETSWEFGISSLLVYYPNRDTTNRLSEINAFTFLTLEQQYGLWLDHALYTDKSQWFFLGRARFQQFPLLYYGQGPDVSGEELAEIDGFSIALRERLLRNIWNALYVGLELDFQRFSNVEFNRISEETIPPINGLNAYTNFGIGVGLVYDNRHNVLNVREGFFGETGFLHYSNRFGSDFNFTSFFLDTRYFHAVTQNQVWASQLYLSHVEGEPPFNQLSLMGGESLMRGYYLGRYRDNTLIAAQTEYRFLPFSFSKRWGAAAFFAAGTVADQLGSIDFSKLKVAGGGGVRFLIFPGKDIFTRFDVAFTEDGPGYYFYIGEAF